MDNRISIAAEIAREEDTPATATSSIAAQIKAEQERKAQIDAKLAEDQNARVSPELQAKALPLAKANNLPVDVARRQIDKLEMGRAQPELDRAKTIAPSYAAMLQTVDHGPIAQSAVSEMPWIERVIRSYGQAWTGGFEDLEASDIGYRRMQGTATPQDLEKLKELEQARKARTDFRLDPVTGFFQYPVASAPATGATFARTWDEVLLGAGTGATTGGAIGAVSGPGAVPAAGAGAVTGAGIGLRVGLVKESYEQLAGDAYNEALSVLDVEGNPLDEDTAYTIATFAGGIGAVAELLPFEKALDTMPFLKGVVGREGARRLAKLAADNPAARASLARIGRVLKVGGAEAFTEVIQEATLLEGIITAGGVTDERGNLLADQRLDRYGQAAVGGFAGGTTLGAAGEAVTAGVDKVQSVRQLRAEAKQQALVELGDRIRASRVNGMSPETVVAHAKQIDADGGAPQMSAPAEKLVELFQAEGLTAEQVQQQFPTLAAALDEAAQTGAEVTLNAESVVKLARLEGFSSITGDIRTSPDEMTANEMKEQGGEFDNLVANVTEEEKKAAVRASIENQYTQQLVAAGTEPRAAATMAKVHASTITNLAERSGMDADALLKRFPLRVTGDQQTDMTAVDPNATMFQRDVLARTPELQDGIRKLQAGEITREQFSARVDKYKPVAPYAAVPQPATLEEMQAALTEDKVPKVGLPDQLQEGHQVGLRLDIPAYARHGTWVVSVHEAKAGFAAGPSIGYSSVARATNVELGVVQNAAANIAGGKPKATIAVMKGAWKPTTPEQAKADADAALKDPAWRQIGMDPERHAYFYDRETMQPITNAEEVIQIGPLVLGKNVTYGDTSTFLFQSDPKAAAQNLIMVAKRGERAQAKKAEIIPAEEPRIIAAATFSGLSEEEIRDQILKHKRAHPEKQGWAPLVFKKIRKDEASDGTFKLMYEYDEVPYAFNTLGDGNSLEPGTPDYNKRVKAIGKSMAEEVRSILQRARSGDKNAQNILAQAGWYKAMRSRLRQEFGGLGDLFADLLGATSPNTPVRENWKNAVDSLRRASRGDFDDLIEKWVDWADQVNALELEFKTFVNQKLEEFEGLKADRDQRQEAAVARRDEARKLYKEEQRALGRAVPDIVKDDAYKAIGADEIAALRQEASDYTKKALFNSPEWEQRLEALQAARKGMEDLLPTKETGSKYGFNGRNVANAMIALWRVVKNEDPDIKRGGTKPKAINFSGNLIGFRNRATIDVWAARMLQRLAGFLRIPSMAEGGVSGDMREDGTTTLQFGFGQDVFGDAVARIRKDPEMNQDPTLAAINDDDLQAVVWFIEKELWTVNGWTSVAGEGGSFELEANLTGPKDQARITQLRRIIDSSAEINKQQRIIDDQTEIKKQQAVLNSKKATDADKVKAAAAIAKVEDKKEKARQKLIEVEAEKEAARHELAASERTVDRFVGGLSIQMSKDTQGVDFVPTDADMEQLGNRIRTAVYETDNGTTVLASKSLSTEGRYGSVERAIDLEVVAREGYDPKALWLRMLREAQQFKQDSTFLSRVLREGEQVDYLRHRPGVEIYFQDAAARGQLEKVLADLAKEGVQFLTVVVDGRRMPGATEGGMPPAVGVRLQYVPEFEQRYGFDELSSLDDAALAAKIEAKGNELKNLAAKVAASVPGVSFAGRFWYETEVAFAAVYQEKIDALTAGDPQEGSSRDGAGVWAGQPIRQGLEDADRHVRETASREPGGQPGGVLGRDAEGVGPDGNQTLYQLGSERTGDGAGRDQGRGIAPLPGAPQVEGAAGPDPRLLAVAERYARENGIDLRRQGEFVEVNPERAARIAGAYEEMLHAPQDPAVKEAYADLIRQTKAQYDALIADGYVFSFFDGNTDPYGGNPWNAMRDLRANKRMAVYGTYDGYGTEGITGAAIESNPMLEDTGLRWVDQKGVEHPVTANDLFRAVHDAFGHGLEGAGFRARGEENAWQAHVRLFTGPAVGAITSETRGQNSWLNYGPYGEKNRTAKLEDTVFAEQKTGLMPPWTWEEGRAADEGPQAGPSSSGTVLNQRPQTTQSFARGSIAIAPGRANFEITLTGRADLSTFMHEAGHYYLEVMQALVESGDASPQLVEDMSVIRKWMGLEPANKMGPPTRLDRKQHEQFARGWEAYLMEGRAPSAELQGAFNRFRAWLVFIYKRLTALNVELNDDIRGVMDRLIASDAEIAEARTNIGWAKPLPKEALFLTDDEYDRYVEAWNKASEAQQREVDARLMLEAARETQQAWKDERRQVFEEEKAKLAETRGHRAWKLLTTGEGLGAEAPGRTTLKIDPATVPSEWSRDAAGVTDEMGLPLDAVAEILGFDSGEQMLSLIAGAKFAEREIPRRVKQIMAERHGDLDMAALADIANAAVHSDKTQEVLLTEFRGMAAKAGLAPAPVGMTKWMAAQAQQKVLGLTRRQLDPMRWRRAELSAAQKAAKEKDPAKAVVFKRQQMMAAAMYKATIDAEKRVDTIRKKLVPFTKNDRRAKLGKAGDLYLDGIDQILEDIQLKPMSMKAGEKLTRLEKLVAEADANGEPLVLPDKLRAMLGKKNFADMTLEELEGVHDAVMNIWHLAKLKNELKARDGKRKLDEALDQIEQTALANLKSVRQSPIKNPSMVDSTINFMRWGRSQLNKFEFLFGWLDGKPSLGLAHQLIYQPIADARAAEYTLLKKMSELVLDPLANMPREQWARWTSRRTFMGDSDFTGQNIIAVALNMGNEGNKKKLLEGYGWNEQRLKAELDAFMTKADWDMVQHIWNSVDTLWPTIEGAAKKATGIAPPKVVPSVVETPFGTYAGGYYPVAYEPKLNLQVAKNIEKNAIAQGLFPTNFLPPTVSTSATKERTGFSAPIRLSLDVLSQHLTEEIHNATHFEAVAQVYKIWSNEKFRKLMSNHFGPEFLDAMHVWIRNIAANTSQTPSMEMGDRILRHLRLGGSIASMALNVGTGIKQLIGITAAADALKPGYFAAGVKDAWLSPSIRENWRFALKESQELEMLIRDYDRDVKQINDAFMWRLGVKSLPTKVAQWGFAHIGYMQLVVNVATWHGAYKQGLAENNGSHEKAVMFADSTVRMTQSAGSLKDLSAAQMSGEGTKLFTLFYTWYSILYNRIEDIKRKTKSVIDTPKALGRLSLLMLLPSVLGVGYNVGYAALMGPEDGEDEEEMDAQKFITQVALETLNQPFGAIPGVRNIVNFGGPSTVNVPLISQLTRMERAFMAVKDLALEGDEMTRSEKRALANAVSVLFKLPIAAPYNLIDDLVNGKVQPKN